METHLIFAALFVLALTALDLLSAGHAHDSRTPVDDRRTR